MISETVIAMKLGGEMFLRFEREGCVKTVRRSNVARFDCFPPGGELQNTLIHSGGQFFTSVTQAAFDAAMSVSSS